MAKIKFGMMMTDARGKLGGQVFSKNRSGAYVRTKVTPVNPQTTFQQANRVLLGSLSSNWSTLTAEQRSAWNNQVINWQKTNVFGDLQKPTGKNLFTALNKNRSFFFPSLPLLVDPPAKTEFANVYMVSATLGAVSGSLNIQLAGAFDESQEFRVRATPSLSAGTSYVKNQLRNLEGVFSPSEVGAIVIFGTYPDRFGLPTVGTVVGIELTQITENGELGVPSFLLVSISA